MSEAKLISPLLDDFAMGAPISSHHGVRCCPAMKQDSDKKYIVKIISIPASQVQLEALLLTGAYKGPGDAMDYFKEMAEGVEQEASLLARLSKLEGFLAYEDWQIVPMEDNKLGYQIYLLGSYKRSLERHIRRNPLTQKEAVHLGIDVCSALASARRCGFLYIDLKPSNIFLSDDKEFRIGDLGFVEADSIKFTSLPVKYRSAYSAPETLDPMNTLNSTVDTYALGMILYQIFNNGSLPNIPAGMKAEYPHPANSDEELGAILCKAIAADPADRWSTPEELGKALGEYLDSGVFNPAALPWISADISSEEAAPTSSLSDTQVFSAQSASLVPEEAAKTQVLPLGQISAAISADTQVIPTAVTGDTQVIPSVSSAAPLSGDTQVIPAAVSAAVSSETKVLPSLEESSSSVAVMERNDKIQSGKKEPAESSVRKPPKRARVKKPFSKKWIVLPILLLVLLLIGYAGLYYYQNYYVQAVHSLSVEGMHDRMTVTVDTEADDALLQVTCTDSYGNSMSRTLENGKAEFLDLLPNSQYKITLDIDGFHKLVGQTSDVFNTESRTEIVSFSGITASESGSVLLTFAVEGPEPEQWILTYSAEGEPPIAETFSGHSITVKGLVVPKTYTFTLNPSTDIYLIGNTSLEFTASPLVMAQNLSVTSCDNELMTIHWDTPDNQVVENWSVRVYNDSNYDKTQFTVDNEIVFDEIDPSHEYFIEVTANDMTQPARASITANPITIASFQVNEDDPGQLIVEWEYRGADPEGGWLLMYSLDGSMTQSVVKCETASAVISPRLHGTEYHFVIQAADNTHIFNSSHSYQCPQAGLFSDQSFDAAKTTAFLLETPDIENWNNGHVTQNDYKTAFSVGQKISVLLYCESRFFIHDQEIDILYVIRNSSGDVLVKYIAQEEANWHDLWVAHNSNYAELDLSSVPQELGEYTLQIYFNNQLVSAADFSIVE